MEVYICFFVVGFFWFCFVVFLSLVYMRHESIAKGVDN